MVQEPCSQTISRFQRIYLGTTYRINFGDICRLRHNSWIDPSPLPTNVCASYAIMPADREGQPDFLHIEISRDASGQSTAFCGDAVAPVKSVSNMQISYSFTNDNECY